jgi:hypothetical protein
MSAATRAFTAVIVAGTLGLAAAAFGATGDASSYDLYVTIAADSHEATMGSEDGYTVSIRNATDSDAQVDEIRVLMPGHGGKHYEKDVYGEPQESNDVTSGFDYIPGSTTGLTTADPTQDDRWLLWPGTVVPASSSVSLHFGVRVATVPAYFTAGATADAEGLTVLGTAKSVAVHVSCLPDFCLTLTVDPTTVPLGGVVTYTGTITNETEQAVTITSARVTRPPGDYIAGSTRGALTTDPIRRNANDVWTQQFVAPAQSTTTFSFDLTATSTGSGVHTVQARVYLDPAVEGFDYMGTGPTAPLKITSSVGVRSP